MAQTDDLLENARAYERGAHDAAASEVPARRVAVLVCMDARIDPYALLGLRPGDAHVIRNAGGVVTDDAIRSLSISQSVLGTEEVLLIQHTRCGLLGTTDEELAGQIEAESGARPPWGLHTFTDLDQSVRDGVERIRTSPFLPRRDAVRGFVFEVESGRLREVA
jgi:carbonic anhydrase